MTRRLLALASLLLSSMGVEAFAPTTSWTIRSEPGFARSLETESPHEQSALTSPRRPGCRSTRLWASSVAASTGSLVAPLYMALLALQFAFQPVLTKKFAPSGIIRSTYVLMHDLVRLLLCLGLLVVTGSWSSATQGWSLGAAWVAAGIPAVLYMMQNYCSLMAYQNLLPLTYNVLVR